jgi:Cof subfamily protein (haloacid dehalogenase superfamily)
MDGTLLDSASNVLPSSVQAIQAALRCGVRVMLATGKARPAAMAALAPLGLAGDGLVVGPSHPGIFLQGLAVHDFSGALIAGGALTSDVVRQAFEYAEKHDIAAVGFTGEECVTLNMKPEVKELHERYYEPLAEVARCLRELLEGPPLRKLLFMAPPEVVETRLKAHWNVALENTTAQPMQAVPTMLEVVPRGWNKWVGMQALLAHESVDAASVMAIGDGGNDLELVANAGIGVAMANGVEQVKSVAHAVVASNDEGGVAEAIERFIL